MSTMLGIDNAIGWAHWQMRGGWKNTLLTSGAYMLAMSMLIYFTVRLDPRHQSEALAAWRAGLLTLQTVFLVIFAGSRVSAAIRSDINTRMIESHRLMPVEPIVAISGYLWGPTSQAIALFLVNLLIGAVVVSASGIGLAVWIGPNIVLAIFALFAWVVAAFAASLSRAPNALLLGLLLTITFAGGQVLTWLPAVTLLLTPINGTSIYVVRTSSGEVTWPMLMAVLLQAMIAVPLYIGAARKYRRAEDSALGIGPGLLLLAGWVLASVVGINDWDSYFPRDLLRGRVDLPFTSTMFVTSLLAGMLLSLAPISNAARRRRGAVPMIVALACVLIMLILCVTVRGDTDRFARATAATAVILAAFTISTSFLLRSVCRFTRRGWPFALGWILLLWMVPLVADSLRWALSLARDDYQMAALAGFSPVGALMIIWSEKLEFRAALPGVVFQACCAVGWALIYYVAAYPAAKAPSLVNASPKLPAPPGDTSENQLSVRA